MTLPGTTRGPDAHQGAVCPPPSGLRLGLCCQFVEAPIRFCTTTAAALARLPARERLDRLAKLVRSNAESLLEALRYCATHGIGSFRILSSILPLRTHPTFGYDLEELPDGDEAIGRFEAAGRFAREHGIRTGFHPDQFVVLNSPDSATVLRSVAELEAQAQLAVWTAADTLNLHAGGAYGDKRAALDRLRRALDRLPDAVRQRLTLENDDRVFTPRDLAPVCWAAGIPLVYDVHHHRCCPDGWSVAEATAAARETWNREPVFHISSPLEGWNGPRPERHHDFVDPADFPTEWLGWPVTVEVEAKAKERAVRALLVDLARRARTGRRRRDTDRMDGC